MALIRSIYISISTGGGTAMIFAMARRMALRENSDDGRASTGGTAGKRSGGGSSNGRFGLPRFRPTGGISDVNPQFRTQSPVMNNQGYAGTIWRNVRKRDKPAMWRYALRTYDRMLGDQQQGGSGQQSPALRVERTNIHHEGALVACAKLGYWERALEIYRSVEESDRRRGTTLQQQRDRTSRPSTLPPASTVYVTDNMVMSVVRACVRGARQASRDSSPLVERRAPLDAAVQVLNEIDSRKWLPLVSHHVNPIAAAYQSLGLYSDASDLIQSLLTDRNGGTENEDGTDFNSVNVNNLDSKDKASYSLLVNSAVSDGDYASAVDALRDMTEAGLYPGARHLNAWTEVSERKTKHRTTRSWTKKREEILLENFR